MKTNQSNIRAGAVAAEARLMNRRGILPAALIGFGVGVVSAAAYLLLGGEYFVFIPRWAAIVFSPGFLVGFKVNDWGLSREASKVVGVLAVGLAYAALAALARFGWLALKHRRQPIGSARQPPNSSQPQATTRQNHEGQTAVAAGKGHFTSNP